MNGNTLDPTGCACNPFPAQAPGQGCAACSPNMILTCEEEGILAKMREIKGQVQPIAAKLKDIQREMGESASEFGPGDLQPDWHVLNEQLLELRNQWKTWQERLEDAIEKKLIFLGHREPR